MLIFVLRHVSCGGVPPCQIGQLLCPPSLAYSPSEMSMDRRAGIQKPAGQLPRDGGRAEVMS